MKLICPDCGKQYDSGKFCPECGGKLQEIQPELVCPSCGYKAKSGKFCPECGTKLTEQTGVVGNSQSVSERKFNEKDPRFSKYYDKKGYPRTIPQEERAVAIEELTPFVEQNVAEAKMLLGNILCKDTDQEIESQGISLLKEAEEAGDKLAYYLMGIEYYWGADIVDKNDNEAEKRWLAAYDEFHDAKTAGYLSELYLINEEKRDYAKAFEYATIAAEDDDTRGFRILGALYENGWGVDKNILFSLENYKMAAALGDIRAMNLIGRIYLFGKGIDTDPQKAFYWFNEAAQKEDENGMYDLGCCYKNGIGVKSDMENAAECFKKAAELGHVGAMCQLGDYYQKVLIDKEKAVMWFEKAAEEGRSDAMYMVARLSLLMDNSKSNQEKAEKWFRKAAELDNTDAMVALGIFKDFKNDDRKAYEWLQKAVNKGNLSALSHLAGCYIEGRGVPVNLQKAYDLLIEAIESGEDNAVYELVKVFEKGYGTNQDKEKAFNVYLDAAEEGNSDAMRCLGICYMNGIGTEVDIAEAREWLELTDDDDDKAQDILNELYEKYDDTL
ncbi:MAG: zinc ribbon domain-containing protein [Bacteroidaceae bacterium]|nr:zinc ribbon domain-containing protein [Bacteroidaceae bacterium]